MAKKPVGEPSWRYRRTAIFLVVVWGCFQLYLLINAQDTRVNETIAWGWQLIIAALVLGYTGFATAQDVAAIWRTRSGTPYRDDAYSRQETIDSQIPPEDWTP